MTIVCYCILQKISDHRITILIIILMLRQIIINCFKRMSSIIIICIDNSKWPVDLINAAEDCMSGSPRFHSAFRNFKTFRNVVDILKYIRNLHIFCHTVSYCFSETVFIFFLYNKNNLLKSGSFCIKQGKIHNDVSLFINWIDLFKSAITASHSCCHNY